MKRHIGKAFRGGIGLLVMAAFLAGCNITGSSANGSTNVTGYPIVDTGQVTFYDNTAPLSTAPTSSSDSFYGQDAQFSGLQPSYRDNGDGTVTDLNTGLMWVAGRSKTDKVTWDEAVAGAATCNVGGYTDWRMPTIKELYSLIEFTGNLGSTDATSVPYIDTNYFTIVFGDVDDPGSTTVGSRVIDGQDWSATEYVSATMQGDATVFGVNFIDGRIKGYPKIDPATGQANTKYVRYVRGNDTYGINDFVDNGDGAITDSATGLMWAQDDSGSAMNWADALAWVQTKNAQSYLGHSDWRLPNAKELQSIVDYSRSPDTTNSAAIDPLFNCTQITNEGGNPDYPFYWTSTTHVEYSTYNEADYLSFGRALGWMQLNGNTYYTLVDAHGAGAQRSDPKSGSYTDYPFNPVGYDLFPARVRFLFLPGLISIVSPAETPVVDRSGFRQAIGVDQSARPVSGSGGRFWASMIERLSIAACTIA